MSTANDDVWMSENSDDSDIEFDEAEPPLAVFDGLKKGFLLNQAKRKNNASSSQRHQSEPPRLQKAPALAIHPNSTPKAPTTQAKRSLKEEIIRELGHLKGQYGPSPGEAPMSIPYEEIAGFFYDVECWLHQISQEAELRAYERVEKAAKRMEEAADKLENVKPVTSYAQAARAGNARILRTEDSPPLMRPKDEKRVIVKIFNKSEAKDIQNQSRKDIIHRIQHAAGGTQAKHSVLAVQQLKSGDLAVHMDSIEGREEMEKKENWIKAIAPSAVTKQKTWPVMAHGIKVADFPLDAWDKQAKRLIKENEKLHSNLQIRGLRWLARTDGKQFSTLIIETASAEQANRLIREGIVVGYDLKSVERYDTKCRITQCFKCQKYGHISTICMNAEKCGYCGEEHSSESCAEKTQATRMKCAGCNGGNHTAWSKICPARIKELGRAKAAKLALPSLFPVSSVAQLIKNSFRGHQTAFARPTGVSQDENTRPAGASQEKSTGSAHAAHMEGEALEAPKKRKLNPIGRPKGSINKAKTLNIFSALNSSILDFNFSPSQPILQSAGSQSAGATPANNTPAEVSSMSDITS
jgi:hypothetical protein